MHRSKAAQTLSLLSQSLELYRIKNGGYENAKIETLFPADFSDNHYQYVIEDLSSETYLLKAIPLESDPECGILTLNALHEKGSMGLECW